MAAAELRQPVAFSQQVALVEQQDCRDRVCPDFSERLLHHLDVLAHARMTRIRDNQKQVCFTGFLQDRPERSHEPVRKVSNESHGI